MSLLISPEGYLDIRRLLQFGAHGVGTVDSSDAAGSSVDCRGIGYAVVVLDIGTVASAVVTLRESSDDSAFTDIAGAVWTLTASDNHATPYGVIRCNNRLRYLDAEVVVASSTYTGAVLVIPCGPQYPADLTGTATFDIA